MFSLWKSLKAYKPLRGSARHTNKPKNCPPPWSSLIHFSVLKALRSPVSPVNPPSTLHLQTALKEICLKLNPAFHRICVIALLPTLGELTLLLFQGRCHYSLKGTEPVVCSRVSPGHEQRGVQPESRGRLGWAHGKTMLALRSRKALTSGGGQLWISSLS